MTRTRSGCSTVTCKNRSHATGSNSRSLHIVASNGLVITTHLNVMRRIAGIAQDSIVGTKKRQKGSDLIVRPGRPPRRERHRRHEAPWPHTLPFRLAGGDMPRICERIFSARLAQ